MENIPLRKLEVSLLCWSLSVCDPLLTVLVLLVAFLCSTLGYDGWKAWICGEENLH